MKTMKLKEKVDGAFKHLSASQKYTNAMQSPRILKVVVSAGTGSFRDKKKSELALDRLGKITGQRPRVTGAKQSIATFKTRQGDPVGLAVTLRGARMYDFLDKLVHVALPRTKDFHGIPTTSVDEMGNYTLGIKEHTIFPETADEELKDVFGLAVTIVTTAKSKDELRAFLDYLNFPFRKAAASVKEGLK